jgi:hypothetical protein
VSDSIYFELMSAGKKLATVSVRPLGSMSGEFEAPQWAWEVCYTGQRPQRGSLIIPPSTESLEIVQMVLEDYFGEAWDAQSSVAEAH